MALIVGDPAPDFSLVDRDGAARTLADYRGRFVVLYFYPKDDTPGCTAEACRFRDDYLAIRQQGAEVVGISMDGRESHRAFSDKYSLPFPLLSDAGGHVARQYGALFSVWPFKLTRRRTFLVDPQGRVAKIYRKVSPKTHSQEVIADLKALSSL